MKKASDYIQYMKKKNSSHQQDIDDLKKQNNVLDQQGLYVLVLPHVDIQIFYRKYSTEGQDGAELLTLTQ